jgi:hypothetical protein
MTSSKLDLMLSFSLYSEEEIEGKKYICVTIPDFDFFEDKEMLLNELKQMKPYDFKIDIVRVKTFDADGKVIYKLFSLQDHLSINKLSQK